MKVLPRRTDAARGRHCRQGRSGAQRYRWEFRKRREHVAIDVPGPLTFDNSLLMLQAPKAGWASPTCPTASLANTAGRQLRGGRE
ncbi:hypothetical protein [Rhizobacter sp. LjRoot28]|uniref:hypothetical protein n=1 Tax=Rhizobacter sp. LjRoot28 TaxID=3342309 RepID=UPI003ECCBF54